jgi:ADP-heptose:LPS heptosyltransferase
MRSDSYHARLILLLKHAVPTLLLAAFHRSRRPGPLPDAPRILVTRLDGIGDFVLLTPFLRELRRNYPTSTITLAVGRNASDLAKTCPYVDKVLFLDRCPNDRIVTRPQNLIPFVRYLRYLTSFAARHFAGEIDLAIQPKWDADPEFATLLTVLSRAPRRVGYTERASPIKGWCNFGQNLLFTDVLPAGEIQHEAKRSLDIIRYLGGFVENTLPESWPTPTDAGRAGAFLKERGLSGGKPLMAFGVGGSHARRHWPFYGELIRLLSSQIDVHALLLAGPGEERLVSRIKELSPSAIIVEQLPLGALASLLSRCILFVGNDSGPMHLAAAAQRPIIELSCHPVGGDPTHCNSPDRFGPMAEKKTIIRSRSASDDCRDGCVADTPHCIANIRPEEVASAVLELLQPAELQSSDCALPR